MKFEATEYRCEPCTLRQGTPVRELVRMIPKSVVVFGKLVGNEYFCCPICFEPKFDAKTRKPVKHAQPAAAEPKQRLAVVKS
ncbi:hypothetical protein [Bradyrhizobium sp. th.b2]|uniref:hypothetical protein n=1 Tax=Bradyrhizobium sp. th-b2 TaxID=172088 RepID=UPI0012EC75D0|nr:hypothetical protein [Bradyrhizobium sp. th.b2]